MDWPQLTALLLPTFVTFFVVIDPVGLVPFFMTLTDGESRKAKARIARRSVFIAMVILTIFALVGKDLLELLGISLSAFRIAGGLLLFLIAVEMLFEKRTERRKKEVDNTHNVDAKNPSGSTNNDDDDDDGVDVAVFPLAVPFMAGPGSIATIILLMSKYEGNWEARIVVYAVMLTCLLTCFIMFRLSGRLDKIITPKMTKVATRLLGVLLAALSVEFIISGLKSSVLFI